MPRATKRRKGKMYYGTVQAAEYTNTKLTTFRDHLYNQGRIKGIKVGKDNIFSRPQLDDYMANDRYTTLVPDPARMFNSKQAAAYIAERLGEPFSDDALGQHVHILKNITPDNCGGTLLFDKDILDDFIATKRPQGRPKAEAD